MQIAEIDATNEDAPQVAKTYLWDPSEPVATRILHMNVWNNGTEVETLYYTHDLQKNVTALFGQAVERRAQYEYDPYGNLINITGDVAAFNPYRYSSEYHDEDLGLIYYNYRHYNPQDGRWINRDPIAEQGGINLYGFVENKSYGAIDILGLIFSQKQPKLESEPTIITAEGILIQDRSQRDKCPNCIQQLSEKIKKYAARIAELEEKERTTIDNTVKINYKCILKFQCGTTVAGASAQHSGKILNISLSQRIYESTITIPYCGYDEKRKSFEREFVHAIDFCQNPGINNCDQLVMTELRAYAVSDCAKVANPLLCLRNWVPGSALFSPYCQKIFGALTDGPWTINNQMILDSFRSHYKDMMNEFVRNWKTNTNIL